MCGCWCCGACVVAGGGHAWLLGGACVVAGGGGHAWLLAGACMVAGGRHAWLLVGGMRGCWWGACMVTGGVCMVAGGVHGCWQGACMAAGGADIGYDEIRSMSGRYASYWNAFLLLKENLHIRKVSSQILRSNKTITLFVLVSALNIRIVLYFSTGIVYSDSYLMAGARKRRRTSSTDETLPNSQPAKWPGTILTCSV